MPAAEQAAIARAHKHHRMHMLAPAQRQGLRQTGAGVQPCYMSKPKFDQPRGIVIFPFVSGCCDENEDCPFVTGWAGPFYDNPCCFGVWPCCIATTYGAPTGATTDNDGIICNDLCRVPCPCVLPCLGAHFLCWLGTFFCFCTALPCTEQYVTTAYANHYPSCTRTAPPGGWQSGGGGSDMIEMMAAPGIEAMRRDAQGGGGGTTGEKLKGSVHTAAGGAIVVPGYIVEAAEQTQASETST
eukprot:CAMPEP_0115850940 /NCGR_PEP_ID=MMETSP0287-20121206/12222_1 /TAXON_ID=412157 /ORGANISM="Chrysochromulina rotalis, Strain UIO044" /LENGTH=240 /DNA_ID=CAMNT_0003304951 /DNA_START=16 /DNA_END=738 /DNA_ORIENTATION=+